MLSSLRGYSTHDTKNFLVRLSLILYSTVFFYTCFRYVGGYHAYRQSQTNFPIAQWLDLGFSPFNPRVPFIGVKEIWLLELPIFQWIGYLLVLITSLPVDFVSRVFALSLSFGSILVFLKLSKVSNSWIPFLAISCNPYFLYWATTGLVDWLAIFCAVAGVYFYQSYSRTIGPKGKLFLAFSFVFLMISGLIKLPLALFISAIAIVAWLHESNSKRFFERKFLVLYLLVLTQVSVSLLWSKWVNQLYPAGDPRHLWTTTRDNFGWYFGSKQQYLEIFQNVIIVLKSYVESSNVFLLPFLVMTLFIKTKKRFYALILIALCLIYLGIFINLNLVHAYYQFPIIFVSLLLLVFYLKATYSHKLRLILNSLFLGFWFIGLALSLNDDVGSQYLKFSATKVTSEYLCPPEQEVYGPVLSINVPTGPAIYYKCDLKGFDVFLVSEDQIRAAVAERKQYRFAYVHDDLNLEELKTFLTSNDGEISKKISPNWYSIVWK